MTTIDLAIARAQKLDNNSLWSVDQMLEHTRNEIAAGVLAPTQAILILNGGPKGLMSKLANIDSQQLDSLMLRYLVLNIMTDAIGR